MLLFFESLSGSSSWIRNIELKLRTINRLVTSAYGIGGGASAKSGARITMRRARKFDIPMLVATNSVGKNSGCAMKTEVKLAHIPARIKLTKYGTLQSGFSLSTMKRRQTPAMADIALYEKNSSRGFLNF